VTHFYGDAERLFVTFKLGAVLQCLVSLIHRYLNNLDCLSFVVCPLLALHLPRHFPFFAAAINSTTEANKAGSMRH
jgi:hypothetical protein